VKAGLKGKKLGFVQMPSTMKSELRDTVNSVFGVTPWMLTVVPMTAPRSASPLKVSAEQMHRSSRGRPFGGSRLPLKAIREKGEAAVASVTRPPIP
jgi:hypothetical protein